MCKWQSFASPLSGSHYLASGIVSWVYKTIGVYKLGVPFSCPSYTCGLFCVSASGMY